MYDPIQTTARVRIEFRPYSHTEVQALLKQVVLNFGKPGLSGRWHFETAHTALDEINVWIIDFLFSDAADAMLFALKYQRSSS